MYWRVLEKLRYRSGAHFSQVCSDCPRLSQEAALLWKQTFHPREPFFGCLYCACFIQRDKSLIKIEFKLFSLVLIMAVSSVVNTFYISAVF